MKSGCPQGGEGGGEEGKERKKSRTGNDGVVELDGGIRYIHRYIQY
jgi:hypothetical protein